VICDAIPPQKTAQLLATISVAHAHGNFGSGSFSSSKRYQYGDPARHQLGGEHSGDPLLKKPITGGTGSCAFATSGKVIAAPPHSITLSA
jgi:hypothetical protein